MLIYFQIVYFLLYPRLMQYTPTPSPAMSVIEIPRIKSKKLSIVVKIPSEAKDAWHPEAYVDGLAFALEQEPDGDAQDKTCKCCCEEEVSAFHVTFLFLSSLLAWPRSLWRIASDF